jgi:alpha-amylase/alpha-mannosidase (GH57 family)
MATETAAAAGPTNLVLLWHFHQPCYRDLLTGRAHMPWVRLHGIKDYWGMAALLEEFPAVKCAVNFVPALLDQLEAAADGSAPDEFESLARVPAADLDAAARERALEVFFYAN